jgi:Na+/alanine symporter
MIRILTSSFFAVFIIVKVAAMMNSVQRKRLTCVLSANLQMNTPAIGVILTAANARHTELGGLR